MKVKTGIGQRIAWQENGRLEGGGGIVQREGPPQEKSRSVRG
jgi:hypothetical protein